VYLFKPRVLSHCVFNSQTLSSRIPFPASVETNVPSKRFTLEAPIKFHPEVAAEIVFVIDKGKRNPTFYQDGRLVKERSFEKKREGSEEQGRKGGTCPSGNNKQIPYCPML
jgi:hypothetical protein